MDQQRREAKPSVTPLQAPKKFDPEPYSSAQAVEPFSTRSSPSRSSRRRGSPIPLLASELNRRKEPLEAYPLDSMSMVGSVAKGGQPFALLRVDNLLYQVKVGDYLGQNYGRITKIGETEVSLREMVQDAAGEWIERASHPAAAGEGAMRKTQEKRKMEVAQPVGGAGVRVHAVPRWPPGRRTRSSRSPARQQAGRGGAHRVSEPLTAVPAGFSIQTPPRIAIDLPGVGNALGRNAVEINQGNLRSVSVAQAGERTRLVLNLKQAGQLQGPVAGQGLLLVLEPSGRRRCVAAGRCQPSRCTLRPPERRGAGAARHRLPPRQRRRRARGRQPAEHPGGRRHPPAGQEPGGRVPALVAARQPAPRLDVTDFGTPVQSVSTFQQRATACAWSSSRAVPGSTAPTRATTSSCSKCGR
jgi:type IV pilus assembly protein PilP